jgi:hypothetical protein
MILGFVLLLAACSTQNKNNKIQEMTSVKTELIKQQNLEHWKLALIPKANFSDRQYDIEAQYTGSSFINSAILVYRVDTKEKLSSRIIKPDAQVIVSKLDPNEKITFTDLSFPIDTPIQVGLTWAEGSHISNGDGTFQISVMK